MNWEEVTAIIEKETGTKICPYCGTPFTPYHSRQKTCGTEECKNQNKKRYMRERFNEVDAETSERWRTSHRESNKKWREKKKRLRERAKKMDEIIERTQKQMEFDKYIKEHGHEYGKLQMQKTLALVPKIDVNINTKGDEDNE